MTSAGSPVCMGTLTFLLKICSDRSYSRRAPEAHFQRVGLASSERAVDPAWRASSMPRAPDEITRHLPVLSGFAREQKSPRRQHDRHGGCETHPDLLPRQKGTGQEDQWTE